MIPAAPRLYLDEDAMNHRAALVTALSADQFRNRLEFL